MKKNGVILSENINEFTVTVDSVNTELVNVKLVIEKSGYVNLNYKVKLFIPIKNDLITLKNWVVSDMKMRKYMIQLTIRCCTFVSIICRFIFSITGTVLLNSTTYSLKSNEKNEAVQAEFYLQKEH